MKRALAIGLFLLCAAPVLADGSGGNAFATNSTVQPAGSGGTGLTAIGTANQVLGVNNGATALEYKSVTGTANQVTVTHSAGGITLSGPQNLGTSNVPSFSGVAASTNGVVITGGPLTVAGNVTHSSDTVIDAYNASFGAVTAGSTSTVTWTELTDRLGEFVTSSFTVVKAGYYRVTANGGASQTAGTGCYLLKVNGTTIAGGTICATGGTALATVIPIPLNRVVNLAVNDIVRIDASATTANVTFTNNSLTITKQP